MGVFKMFSSSSYDTKPYLVYNDRVTYSNQPNPARFRIDKYEQFDNCLLVLVVYPDCTNYEGKKVMVYKDMTITRLRGFKTLDPHFSNNEEYASPIARFEPTMEGWNNAQIFCKHFTL